MPFDLGAPLAQHTSEAIHDYVRGCGHVRIETITQKESMLVGEEAVKFRVDLASDAWLTFDIFQDGYGIATLFDGCRSAPLAQFDPGSFLLERRRVHSQLLDRQHPVSAPLDDHLSRLRALVSRHASDLRASASPEWQRGGLAYIMSIHFIELTNKSRDSHAYTISRVQNDTALLYKLMFMLEPSFSGLEDTPSLAIEEALTSQRNLREASSMSELPPALSQHANIEFRKDYMAFASWSNVLIVGAYSADVMDDYVFLEKRVQHVWFMGYSLTDVLSLYMEDLKSAKAASIRRLRLQAKLTLQKFRQLPDASLGTGHIRIAEALTESSLVESQVQHLEATMDFVHTELEYQAAREHLVYQRTIEGLLLLLAYLQAVGVGATLHWLDSWEGRAAYAILAAVALVAAIMRR